MVKIRIPILYHQIELECQFSCPKVNAPTLLDDLTPKTASEYHKKSPKQKVESNFFKMKTLYKQHSDDAYKFMNIRNYFIVSGLDKISVFRCLLLIMFVEEILFVICARYWGVIQAESKIYCILEADLLLSVHQSSFNNKRAAQLQLCISNSCRIGLFSSSPSPIESM